MDSADRERLQESRDELLNVLNADEMRGVPVVVLANKQDLPGELFQILLLLLLLLLLLGRKWEFVL